MGLGSDLNSPVQIELYEYLEKRLAQSIDNLHDLDHCIQCDGLVEAAEILTWAVRGMPWNERRRTPLWPNSDREKTSPGLIFLAVHRARCTNNRSDLLRIAWKWRCYWWQLWSKKLKSGPGKPEPLLDKICTLRRLLLDNGMLYGPLRRAQKIRGW